MVDETSTYGRLGAAGAGTSARASGQRASWASPMAPRPDSLSGRRAANAFQVACRTAAASTAVVTARCPPVRGAARASADGSGNGTPDCGGSAPRTPPETQCGPGTDTRTPVTVTLAQHSQHRWWRLRPAQTRSEEHTS